MFYDAQGKMGAVHAENEIQRLLTLGIRERNDINGAFWRDIAYLIARVRTEAALQGARGNLALGDAFGAALSRRLNAEFVTKDRTEIEPLQRARIVDALFIRS